MIGIDTSVLVRYFTNDDACQAARARHFVQHELSPARPGHISVVALAELAWVLRSRYKAGRDEVITAVEALLHSRNMTVQDENAVWSALDECQHSKAAVVDALICAIDRLHGCTETVTFDKAAARIPGMKLLR